VKKSLTVVLVIGALVLTGCGKKSNTASITPTQTPTASTAPIASGGFGAPVTLAGGVSLTISAPTKFTPGTFASNYLPGQAANVFDVTVKNNGTVAIDPTTISFVASSGANTCTDVLDGDNGVSGAPTDAIAAGATSNFKVAIGCDAKAGAPLSFDITVGSSTASIKGKIA
jgi:hypothetical protein